MAVSAPPEMVCVVTTSVEMPRATLCARSALAASTKLGCVTMMKRAPKIPGGSVIGGRQTSSATILGLATWATPGSGRRSSRRSMLSKAGWLAPWSTSRRSYWKQRPGWLTLIR